MSRRVLTAVVVMTMLAVVAFFVPAALAIRSAQQRGELLELQREASIVATRLSALESNDADEFAAIMESDHRLALYTAGGRLVLGDGPIVPDRIVMSALLGNFAEGYIGDQLVAAVPIDATAVHPALVVRIEAPRSESQKKAIRSLALLAGAGVAIVAAAAAVGWLVARRLNRPVEELTAWAASTGAAGAPPPAATGIAEIDALRSALLDDRARIEELLQRERSFSSQVSHQLRTPVAAMRVAIETEIAAPRPDPTTVFAESLGQLDRLESTITSLLALARHTERTLTECDVTALVSESVERWRPSADREQRPLTVSGATVRASVDADAVGHILDILIDNALRHGRGVIAVSVRSDAATIAIDVADEGTPPRHGDPFADSGNDSSHGIGLRLARTLAESSHGHLTLQPTDTTTFRLSLTR